MRRKLSSYTSIIPIIGDFLVSLQLQSNGKYKNTKVAYADLISGPVILGKLIGFNLNPTQTIFYEDLAGGTFQPGDTITDTISGNTAIIISDDGVGSMVIKQQTGLLGKGNIFNNGSGVSADFDDDYYISEELIPIIDGYVTDIRIGNASDTVSAAFNIFISGEPKRDLLIAQSGGAVDALRTLNNSDKFIQGLLNKINPSVGDIKYTLYNNRPDERTKVSENLYVSVVGEGTDVTCDIYIYGYHAT